MQSLEHKHTVGRQAGETQVQADITPLLGTWINTYQATQWVKQIVLAKRGDAFTVRVFSVGPPDDWGEVEIATYNDNIGELGFRAIYDLGFADVLLAANTNKGLIIIVAFLNFKDGSGRTNYLCREFFYRSATD